jgi:4-carboxymuconolactone decarboxylase
MPDDTYEAGLEARRAVLGEEHVERSLANVTDFDRDWQRFVTETAWGSVWGRPGLTHRERSMLVIAILSVLGRHDELALHTRATQRTGASPDDLKEVLFHVAGYAGIPNGMSAFRVVKRTLEEMGAI